MRCSMSVSLLLFRHLHTPDVSLYILSCQYHLNVGEGAMNVCVCIWAGHIGHTVTLTVTYGILYEDSTTDFLSYSLSRLWLGVAPFKVGYQTALCIPAAGCFQHQSKT